MALADSGRAIGAVTRLVRDHLLRSHPIVSVGKPEDAASTNTGEKLNLFLYEVMFDPAMRNLSLREDAPPPLWLVLKYLLTAFDDGENSDSAAAHELLGRGLSVLQDISFVPLDAPIDPQVVLALENNPEPLKLTFDESSVELLSKIMQGSEEHYRLSVAFQVRPIMIVPGRLPNGNLLVGIDYTQTPEALIGRDGVQLVVLPSVGARLHRVEPDRFEVGATLTVDAVARNAQRLKRATEAVELFVRAVENEEKKLRAGTSTLIDAISQRDRLTAARQSQVGAHLALAQALVQLRFETGTLFPRDADPRTAELANFTTIPFQAGGEP